jgi:hypothetical protein
MNRQFNNTPDIVSGYPLERLKFSLILPIERTNIISNPSVEQTTVGYTGVDGALLARTTETQRRGAYSLRVKPGLSLVSGVYYTTIVLVANSTYAASVDVNILGGHKYRIRVFDGVRDLVVKKITGIDDWQRIAVTFRAVTAGSHRIYVEKDSNNDTENFFIDGLQLELCEAGNAYATTYIDGDQTGYVVNQYPPAYYWNGGPHNSSSTRNGQTRAGGREVFFDDYGFTVMSVVGLDMPPVANSALPLSTGGSYYQRTTVLARPFTLVCSIREMEFLKFQSNFANMIRALQPDLLGTQQPLLLRLHQLYANCEPESDVLEIPCNYTGGLEGNLTNYFQGNAAIQFAMYNPYLSEEGDNASLLSLVQVQQLRVAGELNGLFRSIAAFTPSANEIAAMVVASDGIYVGGTGTNVYRIDPINNALVSIGTLTGGQVFAMDVSADKNFVYFAGSFTTIGGIASGGLAYYDISRGVFVSLNTTLTGGSIFDIEITSDNVMYVAGSFTAIGGLTVTGIARLNLNTSIWTKLTSGAGIAGAFAYANTVKASLDGYIYLGGSFLTIDGVTRNNIARYSVSLSTWSSMGSGLTSTDTDAVYAIAIGVNGIIYVGGRSVLTPDSGTTTSNAYSWNGVTWSKLGTGSFNNLSTIYVTQLVYSPINNVLYAGHGFTSGALRYAQSFWNGNDWVTIPIKDNLGTSGQIIGSFYNSDSGEVYFIYQNNSIGNYQYRTPGQTVIAYEGRAKGFPTFVISGSGVLYQISNNTTGRFIYFTGLTLLSGELITIVTTPGSISITSNFRGNMLSYVVPASDIANFFLQPGNNNIGVYMDTAGPAAYALVQYKNNQLGLEGVVR